MSAKPTHAPGAGAPYLHQKIVLEGKVELLEAQLHDLFEQLASLMERLGELEMVNEPALDELHAEQARREAGEET